MHSLDDVKSYINSLKAKNQESQAARADLASEDSGELESVLSTWRMWTDDSLEELGRLGEGASSAVYKVRDIETGLIMTKKSIPATISTPPHQLIRELAFLKGCVHQNITTF